jgi:outer membrane receptor protein involved in Fe transport
MQESSRWRRSPVQTAVALALYGSASLARADDQGGNSLQEVVVTATLRQQDVVEVPYSISAISGEDLKAAAVTDLLTLARAVPSLSLVDLGERYATAEVPTIRGINASNIAQGSQVLTQSPVGVYFGNSPIDGIFLLTDVDRVEVLRGPQGTLYGADSLGGAIRIIPKAPELGVLDGSISGNVGSVAHSGEPSYGFEGYANIPLLDSLALRLSGIYAYDAGFIDAYGFEKRTGGPLSAPVLADPGNPVTSPAVFDSTRDHWNDAKTSTVRASLLWKNEQFSAELAYTNGHVVGTGGPQVNPDFPGGSYPIDPRINFPAGGDYRYFSATDQPFRRDTDLASLDASYDLGFATVSSTSSYYLTQGETIDDDTYQVFIYAPFTFYYTGSPINPRFVAPAEFTHSDKTFSQELRLVSHPSDGDRIDYVVGAFYQHRSRDENYSNTAPGTDTYSQQQGCTAPYYLGASFPNCLVTLGPDATFFDADVRQRFTNTSLYGELTLHATAKAQLTLGGRYYHEDFQAGQSQVSYPFMSVTSGALTETRSSGALFKVNPSFQFSKAALVYATFSQGFRPGGANSFPITGPLQESPQLLSFREDKTNNYEVGIKGRSAAGYSYGLGVFDVEWDHPQIGGYTPNTSTAVVYNAQKARSSGFDAESSGPLAIQGLRYSVSASYANAHLTEDFSLPGNDGAGGIAPGVISGNAGARLPGSPEWSAAMTLEYERMLTGQWSMALTANVTYTGPLLNSLPEPGVPETPIGGFTLGNLSASLQHSAYRVTLYVDNVTDKRAVLSYLRPGNVEVVGGLADYYIINRPREIGLRFTLMGSKK